LEVSSRALACLPPRGQSTRVEPLEANSCMH
jgi:hypothetical protein